MPDPGRHPVLPTLHETDGAARPPALRACVAGLAALLVSAALLSASLAAHAQAAGQAPAAAARSAGSAMTSMLDGKLRFTLPAGFDRTALPPDDRGGAGAVFIDPDRHQMVMITESRNADGVWAGDDDRAFLDTALAAHLIELDKPTPNYHRLGKQSLSIKGLGLRRTDGTTSFFDKRVASTSLIAGSGASLATVMIMTPIEERARHQALVASILDAITASR